MYTRALNGSKNLFIIRHHFIDLRNAVSSATVNGPFCQHWAWVDCVLNSSSFLILPKCGTENSEGFHGGCPQKITLFRRSGLRKLHSVTADLLCELFFRDRIHRNEIWIQLLAWYFSAARKSGSIHFNEHFKKRIFSRIHLSWERIQLTSSL